MSEYETPIAMATDRSDTRRAILCRVDLWERPAEILFLTSIFVDALHPTMPGCSWAFPADVGRSRPVRAQVFPARTPHRDRGRSIYGGHDQCLAGGYVHLRQQRSQQQEPDGNHRVGTRAAR